MQYELIATATFGLEAVVKREVEKLGYEVLAVEDGKVTYAGDKRAIVRSNLWLRTADRVLLKMAEFPAETFDELFEGTKAVAWEKLIPADGKFVVTGTSVKSKLHSVPACQKIVKKAMATRLCEAYGLSVMPEMGADYTVKITLLKDRVTLTVDTSGEGLHKRGYRVQNVPAPIKETLAAALVELSYWNRDRMLVDPCCGSGTIAIEAALLGRNIAPGLARSFAAEAWDTIPEALWKEERKAAFAAIDQAGELRILASDIDTKAVEAARANAEEAGVDADIVFARRNIRDLTVPADVENGIFITNPPYGVRIGEQKELAVIYRAFTDLLKQNPGWSLFLITGDKVREERICGRRADRRRKLYNGRLETCFYQFHGKKQASRDRTE